MGLYRLQGTITRYLLGRLLCLNTSFKFVALNRNPYLFCIKTRAFVNPLWLIPRLRSLGQLLGFVFQYTRDRYFTDAARDVATMKIGIGGVDSPKLLFDVISGKIGVETD